MQTLLCDTSSVFCLEGTAIILLYALAEELPSPSSIHPVL